MEVINAALEQTEQEKTDDIRDKMKAVASTFLTHRQIGEAEAAFKLLPSMTLKHSNVGCQWIATGRKETRTKRFKLASKDELESGIDLVELDNHAGLWYEQQDMLSKYIRRAKGRGVDNLVPSHFGKMYASDTVKPKTEFEENSHYEDNEIEDSQLQENPEDEDDKFHYIIDETQTKRYKLPEFIELTHTYPGEPKRMRKRSYPAVLRFNKPNRDKDPLKYMLNELMLYKAFFNESELENVEELYNEEYNGVRK